MKILKNKTTDLRGDNGLMDYADLILMMYGGPVPGGIPIPEQAKDFRIVDVAEKGGDVLKFEDEDAKRLQAAVKTYRWGIRHRALPEFGEAVAAMSDAGA